jgi:hypothetical protein
VHLLTGLLGIMHSNAADKVLLLVGGIVSAGVGFFVNDDADRSAARLVFVVKKPLGEA